MPLDPKKGQSLGKYTVDFKNGKISFDAPVSKKSPFEGRASQGLGGETNPALLKKMKNLYMDTLGSDLGVGPQVMGMVSGGGIKRPAVNEANVESLRKYLGELVNEGKSNFEIAMNYLAWKYPKLFAKRPPVTLTPMIKDTLTGLPDITGDQGRYNYITKNAQILDKEHAAFPLFRRNNPPETYANTASHELFGHGVIGQDRVDARIVRKGLDSGADITQYLGDLKKLQPGELAIVRKLAEVAKSNEAARRALENFARTTEDQEKMAYQVGGTAGRTFKDFIFKIADQANRVGDPNAPMFNKWRSTMFPK